MPTALEKDMNIFRLVAYSAASFFITLNQPGPLSILRTLYWMVPRTKWIVVLLSDNQGRCPFRNLANSSSHLTFELL
jgi:hypothetical protein